MSEQTVRRDGADMVVESEGRVDARFSEEFGLLVIWSAIEDAAILNDFESEALRSWLNERHQARSAKR